MKYTKEVFEEHLEALRTVKNSKGGLNDYGEGRLALAESVENLILFGVVSSKPNINEIDFIMIEGRRFVHVKEVDPLASKRTDLFPKKS